MPRDAQVQCLTGQYRHLVEAFGGFPWPWRIGAIAKGDLEVIGIDVYWLKLSVVEA
jgi:hypothetical protein